MTFGWRDSTLRSPLRFLCDRPGRVLGFAGITDRLGGALRGGTSAGPAGPHPHDRPRRLLLLDEPCAARTSGGRERLVIRLGALAADDEAPPTVLVTHHVEEIPPVFTHVLLVRGGEIVTAGPIGQALNSQTLSAWCSG